MLAFLNQYEDLFFWLTIASLIGFISSLILLPWLVIRIPEDYFTHQKRHRHRLQNQSVVVRVLLIMIKNISGVILVLAGIAMLVLPGQGIITILLGIMLIDFPGKYKLELWVIKRPKVLKSLNWIRKKVGHSPLRLSCKEVDL